MSDTVERALEVAAAIGALVGGALFGRATKRDPDSDRSTNLPPPPHAGSLLDQDLAALRADVADLKKERAERAAEQAAALAEASRRALKEALRDMTTELRKAAKEKGKPDERPSNS